MDVLDTLIKINSDKGLLYVCIRGILIYIYAIFLIRLGNRRYHFETAFDVILIIIIGSVLSRAINGSSTFLSAILGSAVIIFLHWFFALGSFYSHTFGKFIKGESCVLIKNGEFMWDNLKRNQITEKDLREFCRMKLHHDDLKKITEARLERSGKISFLTKTNHDASLP